MLKSKASVEHYETSETPKELTSAKLSLKAKESPGYVFELSFAKKDNYYRAAVFDNGKKVQVWTKSAQMQGILETAARESLPVLEFDFDSNTKEIKRGKVNVDLQK